MYLAEWLISPPTQAITFKFVPLQFQMLFGCSVSFFFSVLQSHVTFSEVPLEEDLQEWGKDEEMTEEGIDEEMTEEGIDEEMKKALEEQNRGF